MLFITMLICDSSLSRCYFKDSLNHKPESFIHLSSVYSNRSDALRYQLNNKPVPAKDVFLIQSLLFISL